MKRFPSRPAKAFSPSAKSSRAGKFDLALVLPNSPRSAIEVWLAGIPQRIGYARPWRNFFLTQTVPPRTGAVKMRKLTVAEIKHRTGFQPVSKIVSNKMETGEIPVLQSGAHQIHEYLHLAAALGANPEPLAPSVDGDAGGNGNRQEEIRIGEPLRNRFSA